MPSSKLPKIVMLKRVKRAGTDVKPTTDFRAYFTSAINLIKKIEISILYLEEFLYFLLFFSRILTAH